MILDSGKLVGKMAGGANMKLFNFDNMLWVESEDALTHSPAQFSMMFSVTIKR